MIWADSHCHLDFPEFEGDRRDALERMEAAGVGLLVNPGCDLPSSLRALALAGQEPRVRAAVGVHPHEVAGVEEDGWRRMEELLDHPAVVAAGEIGLDFYRDHSPRPLQRQALRRQLRWARERGLPVILHVRDAHAEMMEILAAEGPLRGVVHCFSAGTREAEEYLSLGLSLSFAGPVTFPKSEALREAACRVPLDRLLVETDSPYLSPHPLRGKRNEPARVRLVGETIAGIRGIPPEEFAAATLENTMKLFGIAVQAGKLRRDVEVPTKPSNE